MKKEDIDLTEKAREMFKDDPFVINTLGAEIMVARPDYAKCRLKIKDKHRNQSGAVMGGVYFSLADFTFAVAVCDESFATVTVSANIDYLNTLKGDTVYAETKCRKNGKNVCYYQVLILDEKRKVLCECQFVGYHINA